MIAILTRVYAIRHTYARPTPVNIKANTISLSLSDHKNSPSDSFNSMDGKIINRQENKTIVLFMNLKKEMKTTIYSYKRGE